MSGTLKGGLNYRDKGEEGSFWAASCFLASPSSSLHIERIIGQTGMNNSVDVAGQWGHFMFISLLGPVFWLLMSSIWGDGDSYVHPLRGTVITTPSGYRWSQGIGLRKSHLTLHFSSRCKAAGLHELSSRNKSLPHQLYYHVKDDLSKPWLYAATSITKIIHWDDSLNVLEFSGFKCNCM